MKEKVQQQQQTHGNEGTEKIKANILASLANIKDVEQIAFLTQRLVNAESERTKIVGDLDKLKKENGKIPLLERKLSSVEKMLSKTELSKATLEQLCRELNRTQKEEKEQNQQRLKLMRKTHEETVDAFKKSLNEIQVSVQAKQEQSTKVADVEKLSDNLNRLSEDYERRLNELKQLYENREADFKVIAKTKEEEVGLLQSELENVQKRIKEVWEENVRLKKELLSSEEKTRNAIESEIGLRKVLDNYSEKYSKLLNSLSTSNEAFDKVKKEMEKMNGNLIKVEADARRWRTKVEKANNEIKELKTQNDEKHKAIELKDRQLAQLQELCRRLQKSGVLNGTANVQTTKPEEPSQNVDNNNKSVDCNTNESIVAESKPNETGNVGEVVTE